MKIWLYTVTHNEAKILPWFLRHYEQFCDRITVFDDQSTDGTADMVRACPVGVLEKYPFDGKLDDRQFIQLARETYVKARGQADWVIWCDPDEFLYKSNLIETLEKLLRDGVQVPLTRGFQMISDHFPVAGNPSSDHCECGHSRGMHDCGSGRCDVIPQGGLRCGCRQFRGESSHLRQLTDVVTEGVEDPVYAKPVIFRPEVDMNWEPGKHYVHGNFNRGKIPVLKVLHYRCLGLEYLRERHARNYANCSKANLESGLGVGVYPGHTGHMSEPWFKEVLPTRRRVLDHSTFHELMRVIHHGDAIYANFLRETEPEMTLQPSWGSEHPWLRETIDRVQPQIIIEVGTFLGRSALHMGEHIKALGLDSAIICVDTWLGDEHHWLEPEVRHLLEHRYGRPEFYHTFCANVWGSNLQETIIPLSMDSISGARLLSRLGVKADMIYVDGGHVGGEVYRDLVNFWSLLRPGGAMLMDDYGDGRFQGLTDDVNRFAREQGLPLEVNGHKARLWKPA